MIWVELCWPTGQGCFWFGRTSIGPRPTLPRDDVNRSRRMPVFLFRWIDSSDAGTATRSGSSRVSGGGAVAVGVGVGVGSVGVGVGVGVVSVGVAVDVSVPVAGPASGGHRARRTLRRDHADHQGGDHRCRGSHGSPYDVLPEHRSSPACLRVPSASAGG